MLSFCYGEWLIVYVASLLFQVVVTINSSVEDFSQISQLEIQSHVSAHIEWMQLTRGL